MKKDVLVSIRGLQIDSEDDDAIEIVTNGVYTKKNNKSFLRFEEVDDENQVTKNILTFDEKSMELTRRGGMQVHMTFLKEQKTMTNYGTPFGSIVVGVNTKSIALDESDDNIDVKVEYALEMNYEYLADCRLSVNIKPKA